MKGIVEVRTGTVIVPTSDTITNGTVTEILRDAEFGNVVVQIPALEGTGTGTWRMIDPLLGTIQQIIAAESTTTLGTPSFEFYTGTLTVTATTTNATDGTQSAARDFVYNIYYQTKHG